MLRTDLPSGVSTNAEFWMRFALWADRIRTELTVEMIKGHFHVSRATAYRWMEAWKAAKGAL